MKKESKKLSDEKAKEFLKKMGYPEIKVMKRLEEASSQRSILNLVLASEDHRQILLKVLGEAQKDSTI